MSLDQEYLDALWAEHIEAPTDDTLEQLVVAYVPLARYLAQRALAKAPPYQDREDILSYAHHGLLDAISRFEPGRGFKFETYATRRIAGAIIDGQRRQDPLSRSLRKRVKELEKAQREFVDEHEREPNLEELAGAVDADVDEVRLLQIWQKSLTASLNVLMDPDRASQGAVDGLDDTEESSSDLDLYMGEIAYFLGGLLARLSPRERAFVVYHYCDGLTLREAAERLGLHESRTGQLRGEIMRTMVR